MASELSKRIKTVLKEKGHLNEDQTQSPTRVNPAYQDLGGPVVAPWAQSSGPSAASATVKHAQDPRPKPTVAGGQVSDTEDSDQWPQNKHLRRTPNDPGGHGTLPNTPQGAENTEKETEPVSGTGSVDRTEDEEVDKDEKNEDNYHDTGRSGRDNDPDKNDVKAEGNKYKMHNEDDDNDDDEDKDKGEKEKVDVGEDVQALLDGENLSETFKKKAATVFAAAVTKNVNRQLVEAEKYYSAKLNERVEEIREELAEKVDSYLSYIVENWAKENEIAIETGLKADLVEDFISGLKRLFTENYVEIPEDKVDVVEELSHRLTAAEEKLGEQLTENINLKKKLKGYRKNEIFSEISEGLAETQVEKLAELVEGVNFTDEDEFRSKLETLKESYFNGKSKKAPKKTLTEQVQSELDDPEDGPKSSDPYISAAAGALNKSY